MDVAGILTSMGIGVIIAEVVRAIKENVVNKRQYDTSLILAREDDIQQINSKTQERLEKRVQKLEDDWKKALEDCYQIQVKAATLEIRLEDCLKREAKE